MSSTLRLNCFAVSLLLVPTFGTASAQQAPTFSSDVRVVNVLATVRDGKGNIVKSLNKDDFTLAEDGTSEAIRYFSRETDTPLTLGLLVDTSFSMAGEIDSEKRASGTFATNVLRDGKDSAFLIHFDREVELLRDLTTSREKFVSGLQLLQTASFQDRQRRGDQPGGDEPGEGRDRGARRGGTQLYDSVYLASDEVLNKQQGRKAIIVLSDGMDRGSKTSLDEAIEAAQRANTIVYTLYFEGQERRREGGFGGPGGGGRHGGGWPGGGGGWPGGGGGGRYPGGGNGGGSGRGGRGSREPAVDGKKIMERLAQETGGRMFQVSKKEPLEQIYATIQDELRNQYNLGYTPSHKDGDGPDYRHIQVSVKEKAYKVQAREGYYASRQVTAKPGDSPGSN